MEETLVYVGTYTEDRDEGLFVLKLSREGELSMVGGFDVGRSPSFMALHPGGEYVYVVNEVGEFEGEEGGAVASLEVTDGGRSFRVINRQSSLGGGPCHISLDSQGRFALVANYGGGSVAVLPIREDGSLEPASDFIQHEGSSVNPRRQAGPHAHSINLDPLDRFAIVADLGLDKLLVYEFNSDEGKLKPAENPWEMLPAGAGPRHFTLHPNGEWAYVINELFSTVTALEYDSELGGLASFQEISTLPPGYEDTNWTAEVVVSSDGRHLYASNRGHDSIAVFRIDPSSGVLEMKETASTQGSTPRNFAIDPSGRFLLVANQGSNLVVVFEIDQDNGSLTPTLHTVEVPRPVCIRFFQ